MYKINEDKLIVEKNNALANTAALFSIGSNELRTALSQRVIAAGGEIMQKTHTLVEAEYGRDALAKVTITSLQFYYTIL